MSGRTSRGLNKRVRIRMRTQYAIGKARAVSAKSWSRQIRPRSSERRSNIAGFCPPMRTGRNFRQKNHIAWQQLVDISPASLFVTNYTNYNRWEKGLTTENIVRWWRPATTNSCATLRCVRQTFPILNFSQTEAHHDFECYAAIWPAHHSGCRLEFPMR